MASEYAPIALFAFRRPEHLSACLASLRACAEAASSPLVVFCDGARTADDDAGVAVVRRVAHSAEGFASVRVVERDRNLGLAASVIDGVSGLLREYERIVVVEDDLVVSPDFLRYLNEGLDLYADEPSVVSIHAYVYAVPEPLPPSFFLRGADCWGWATWRRGWAVFDPDAAALLRRLDASGERRAFDLDGAFPYRSMLEDQVAGRIDSWAVRWYASAFLTGGLTLYPGVSLVENTGQDGSGTHSIPSTTHDVAAARMTLPLEPIAVVESSSARAAVVRTLAPHFGGRWTRLGARLRRGGRP